MLHSPNATQEYLKDTRHSDRIETTHLKLKITVVVLSIVWQGKARLGRAAANCAALDDCMLWRQSLESLESPDSRWTPSNEVATH